MLTAALLVACSLVAARPASAAWPSDGLPLATGPAQQRTPVGIGAENGDLFVFWTESTPVSSGLRVQRVTLDGQLASGWAAGGRTLISTTLGLSQSAIAPDGSGGALLAWYGTAGPGGLHGIFGLRMNSEGNLAPGWSSAGTIVCTTTNAQGLGPLDQLLQVCSDGDGGAFVAWTDARNTPPASTLIYDVYAQHVLSDGTLDPAWPAAGLALTTGTGYRYPHALISDLAHGFWLVCESSGSNGFEISRHDRNGAPIGSWSTPTTATRVAAAPEVGGGIFVGWVDCAACPSQVAIRAMRLGLDVLPAPGWGPGGKLAVTSSDGVDLPAMVLTPTNAVIVAWRTDRPGSGDWYAAQRFEPDGAVSQSWPANGRVLATATDGFFDWPLLASDGAGGALLAFRQNLPNLYGSAVGAKGDVPAKFPADGLSLCSVSGDQFLASIVADGQGGAYVLWNDFRNDPPDGLDVYATHFVGAGSSDVPDPPLVGRVTLSLPAPNPAVGACTFSLSLPRAARVRVDVLDLTGRLVRRLLEADAPAGRRDLEWDGRDSGGRALAPGLYLVRASVGSEVVTQRVTLLD